MKSYISLLSSVLFVAFAVLSCNQPEPEVLVTDVSINQASAEIIIGETLQLNATVTPSNASQIEVNWASSAPSVAKVSNQGLVTALSEGTTVITATAGGKSEQQDSEDEILGKVAKIAYIRLGKVVKTVVKHIA